MDCIIEAIFQIAAFIIVPIFGEAILAGLARALDATADAVGKILFLQVSGPRTWQRKLRKRRGQCLACGYDLTGNVSGVCPECGTPKGES